MNLWHRLYGARPAASAAFHLPGADVVDTETLRAQVGRYAAALVALGVGRGDRVSFKLDKGIDVVVLAHACFQIGAVVHPLNTGYTDHEIESLLADARPKLFVCEDEEATRFTAMAARVGAHLQARGGTGRGGLAALAGEQRAMSAVAPVAADDTAALLYTSGTTGRPKGAKITHGNLAEGASALAAAWQIGADDVLLHALPVYHAHGLLTAINTMLAGGGSILFLPRFDAGEVLAALPQASVLMGVPTHYARLLAQSGLAHAASTRLRLAISGSAPLPPEVAARFAQVTGHTIVERYGSTEAAIVTAVPAGARDCSGWVGWPLEGVEVRVATPAGRVARDARGELETRGHNVFSGYWNRPDADREAFTPDGWFITGDLAEIRADGCVRLLGRSKDLVITGGLNVYPGEVENVLDALPAVAQSAVFGVPHPDFGEAVVAVVELEPGASFDEGGLLSAARTQLAAYKTPKRILATRAIPRNALGKVLKSALRQEHRRLFDGAAAQVHQSCFPLVTIKE